MENLVTHTTKSYDSKGNIIEEIEYSTSGDIVNRTLHKYDASSCKVESIIYGNSGAIEQRILSKCDGSGREIQSDTYDNAEKLTGRFLTEYVGNLQRIRGYDANGTLTLAMDIEKDSNESTTRMVLYDAETGKATGEFKETYNDKGKKLNGLMYGENGELLAESRYSYSYNEDGMDEITKTTSYIAGILNRTTTEGLVTVKDQYTNWIEKRTYKKEEQFGQVKWVLTGLKKRIIRYRED